MAPPKIPTHQAITMRYVPGAPGKVYFPLTLTNRPTPYPPPSPSHLLLHPTHLSLNHRDLFLRKFLYPSPSWNIPILSDGTCIPLPLSSQHPSLTSSARALLPHRLLINPASGWSSSPLAPESSSFEVLGGTQRSSTGLAAEIVTVDASQCEICPAHLTSAEAAALPLAGLTAWRALVSKSGAIDIVDHNHTDHDPPPSSSSLSPSYDGKRRTILITGCGGGVATMLVLFAVAMNCRVFVTGGTDAKVKHAISRLGAHAGVVYKSRGWERQLKTLLPEERPFFDAVIDGAGGDIVKRAAVSLLKPGGVVVSYGMTAGPKMDWWMWAVLKNIELRGSTMGSRREFGEMVRFVEKMRIKPVVSRVERGRWGKEGEGGTMVEALDRLFKDMNQGTQFGKLVLEVADADDNDQTGETDEDVSAKKSRL